MSDIGDFPSRLHQLAIDEPSLNTLVIEGDSYWSLITIHEQDKWEREARMQRWRFTGNPSYLAIQVFNAGSGPGGELFDELSQDLYDEENINLYGE